MEVINVAPAIIKVLFLGNNQQRRTAADIRIENVHGWLQRRFIR